MPAPRRKKQSGAERIREAADNGGDTPTKEAERRQPPTTADKGGDTPTSADSRELVRLTARVARWQRTELEKRAEAEGRLLSELVREAVREYLRK